MNMTIDGQAGPNTAVFTGFNAERSDLVEHSVDLENLDEAGYGAVFNAGRDGFFSAEGAATPMARFEDQMMFREGWDPREKAERARVDAVSKKAEVLFLDMSDPQVREKAKVLHGAAFVDDFVNLSEEDKQHVAVRYVKDSVYGSGDDGYGRMAAEYGLPYSMGDAEWFSVLGGKLKDAQAERQRVEGMQEQVKKESARVYEEVLSGKPVEEVYGSFSSLDPEVQVKLYEALDLARERRGNVDTLKKGFFEAAFPHRDVEGGMKDLKGTAWTRVQLNELASRLSTLKEEDPLAYAEALEEMKAAAGEVKGNSFMGQIGAGLLQIGGGTIDLITPPGDRSEFIKAMYRRVEHGRMTEDEADAAIADFDLKVSVSKMDRENRQLLKGIVNDMQSSSGKDAWLGGEWRDALAQGVSTTLAFQATPWLIFGSSTEDRMDQLLVDGSGDASAILRGVWSGAVDVGSEYIFGLGKFTRWGRGKIGGARQAIMSSGRMDMLLKQPMVAKMAAMRVPGAGKLIGYMAGAKVAWRNKKFGSALLRYGAAAGGAGIGEMSEEYAGILAGVPGDFLLASAFGEDNATALVDGERRSVSGEIGSQWWELSKDSGTWFSMMAMGALFAGANIGQFRRDALWSTMDARKMRAFGLAKEEAERLANIADPEVRIPEVRKAIATNTLSLDEKMRNVKEGFTAMDQDMEWLQGMAGYEDAVESGLLPTAERQDDGKWKMTVRVRNEADEMVDAAPFVLDEKAATAFMQAKLDDSWMRQQMTAQNNLVANAMVDRLAMDDSWIVRDIGQADTQASMERLATVARLRMDEAAAEGKYMVSQIVDSSVDADLTLGQVAAMAGEYGRRVELEKMRSRDELQRRRMRENERRADAGEARLTDAEWDGMVNAMFRSAANRTPLMDRGKTLLRYAKKEIGAMDVIEEVSEDNFVREKMAGRSNAWWAEHFRKLQEEMKMPGAFLPDAGEVTDGHVIEAVSKLVKSDLLARAESLGISDWLKSFLRMIAKWVDEAMAFCRLGRMFNDLAAAGKLDGDFVREIHDFTGKTADYFKDLQEGAARDAVHNAVAAAVAVEDAADMRRLGLDAASFSLMNDVLDNAAGDGVEFGHDERDADSGSQDADAAFTSIEVDGRDSGGSSGGGEGMQRGRDSEFLPDDAATGTADGADGYELLHSVAQRVERLGVRRHRVSRRDIALARKHGFYTGDIVEVSSDAEGASLFRECIEAGKASQVPYGECVYTYEAEEYGQMRLFLTPDGSAGFALKDGDMVSVFATKGSKLTGKPSLTMVALAVTQGATKGDCYGTMLPALYARFGFRAVARDAFNAEFSPESMQEPGHMERFYAKYNGGKPDIVYMVWDGSSRDSVIRDYDEDAASEFVLFPYAKAEGEDESAYDACVRIQSGVVEQFRGRYDAEELVSARESGDPMRLAAAMRGLRLSKADLKARDLIRGNMGSAATVGSLAGDALYGAFAEGKVTLAAASRVAAAAPMNDMLQEAALAELEHVGLEEALATMQAVAALGASLDMEKARAMGAYALKKQNELKKRLDDERAQKMKLSEQDELIPLMAELERWRNWPVHPEMVAEVLNGVFGGASSFSVNLDERNMIVENAQASGTYLKAPNGKDTNLHPEQWVVVRTEAFKRWFGDWEKDPGNASRVVDENGEPLCVYHGTRQGGFTVFDTWGEGDSEGSGSFFTSKNNVAGGYSDKSERGMYAVFLNMRNPLIQDFEGSRWDSVPGRPSGYFVETEDGESEWYGNREDAEYALANAGEGASLVEDYADDGSESNFTLNDLAREAREEGYDGVIARRVFDPSIRAESEEHAVADDFVVFEPEQIKSATNNRGTFDGGNPDITFSLRFDRAADFLIPSRKVQGHAAFVNTVLENIRRDVELWRWYESLASTEREKALVAVGRAVNLVQAVAGFLPQKYRFSVNPYLRKLQVFSELATTGDLDFTRPIATLKEQSMEELRGQYPSGSLDDMVKEYGERKLHEVMTDLLQKTAGKLQRWGKDGVVKEIERVLDSVKPAVDEKSKMYKRGAVSAEAFRKVKEVEKLMEMSQEEKEAELERLEAALAKAGSEGEPTAELESDLLAVATFGNMDGMDMDQAAAAHEALKDLVTFERFAWDDVLERRRQEQKGVVSRVVRMFGGRPDRNRLHRAMEEKPRRDWKHLSQVLESMPQMLLQLERHDATREFGKAMRGRITDAGLSIKHAQKRRTRKVLALSKKFLGRKYWKAMRDLKEVHDTGIDTKRQVRRKVETTVSNARRLLEMSEDEREAERRRSAVEGGVMATDELTEQDVAEIGRFLEAREADAAAYERERMEWERMSVEDRAVTPAPKRPRDVKRISFSYVSGVEDWKNIRLSKGQALYVILMSEQAHYSENLASQGFTEETLDALREWIGDGMVQFGYGLRDLFAEQGEKIAGVYEEAYGVPFPRVENYFAARFDVARMDSAEAEVLKGSGAMPGGGKGFMKLRQLHYHNVDLSRDALSVFMEATEISDNWLYTQDIVADFRAYFSDEEFKDAMVVNMGRDNYENMKQWVAMIETMGARQAVNMGAADRMTNRIYSGSAMAILGYKFETIVRQASGILNGWAGDSTIGFTEWMATMSRMKHGKAPMTISRMAESEVMQDRYMGMLQLVSSQTRERHEKDLNGVQAVLQAGMNAMEKVDVLSNAVGMAAVYNIHYARAQKAGMTESEADVAGWGAVRDSLSMAAQPQQWMDRTKIAQMKSPLGKALLFMMSENFNKVGLISSLWKSGGKQAKMKAFKVWAAYGVFNALIGALLDFIKEDPDEWEKREWWGYIWSAVCGPLSGVPVVGEALEWAVDGAFKAFGIDAKVYIGSSARGVIDLKSGGRAVFNLYEMMFGDKEGEFEDYVKECVRLSRMGGVVGGAVGGTAGSAVILGSALMNPVKTVTNFWHSLGLDG